MSGACCFNGFKGNSKNKIKKGGKKLDKAKKALTFAARFEGRGNAEEV
jgi:hypothetical protein